MGFKKGLVSIHHHESLFESMIAQKVPPTDVDLLRRLYAGQNAKVWNQEFSREFKILKGAKQVDPISSFLLNGNSIMELDNMGLNSKSQRIPA